MIEAVSTLRFNAPLHKKCKTQQPCESTQLLRKLANDSSLAIHTTHSALTSAGLRLMKEAIIYSISGCSSLFILAYTVHMFIGGMVSEQTEYMVMAIVVLIAASAMAWMVSDVLRRRKAGSNDQAR